MPNLWDLAPAAVKRRIKRDTPVVPVVRLSGIIGQGSQFQPGLNMASVAAPLEKAFSFKRAVAVALIVNSPGGSPVQSNLIYRRIRQLAAEKEKPVYVYVEDVAASGGYWIACAGDEIIADQNSIVGSIGVISAGFGFDRALEKLGVDRRVYTAGTRKMTLDPFTPEKAEDVRRLRALQRQVHQSFVDHVKSRREGLTPENDKELFTGEFWTATQALPLGLVDKLGDLRADLHERFGEEVVIRLIGARRRLRFPAMMSGSGLGSGPGMDTPPLAGAIAADDWISAVENRLLWQRFGL